VIRQVWITFGLRHDAFEVVLAGESEQPLYVVVDVIAVEETFTTSARGVPLGMSRIRPKWFETD
jgi:hypothetical protein